MKFLPTALSVLSLSLCLTLSSPTIIAAETPVPGEISVTGTASRSVAPDYAVLSFSTESFGSTALDAKRKNDRIMSDIISVLISENISKKDIRTTSVSFNPRYDYTAEGNARNRIVGYSVLNSVSVRIDDTDSIARILDRTLTIDDAVSVNGLTFAVDESISLGDSLLSEAAGDARRKAEVVALALGQSLGKVKAVIIETPRQNYYGDTIMPLRSVEISSATPIEHGSMTVSRTVTIIFYTE